MEWEISLCNGPLSSLCTLKVLAPTYFLCEFCTERKKESKREDDNFEYGVKQTQGDGCE